MDHTKKNPLTVAEMTPAEREELMGELERKQGMLVRRRKANGWSHDQQAKAHRTRVGACFMGMKNKDGKDKVATRQQRRYLKRLSDKAKAMGIV